MFVGRGESFVVACFGRLTLIFYFLYKTINHIFKGCKPYRWATDTGRNGALISMAAGESSGYAMAPLQARGVLFIHPQTQGSLVLSQNLSSFLTHSPTNPVHPGMVIGESEKCQDLYLNPCIKKRLTNKRASRADEKIILASPWIMTLEEALAYMADDEIVEVTPGSVRLRKIVLDQRMRMRMKGGKK
jgi:GTP-binding protein